MIELLALVGITTLCGGWMAFQLWLGRRDPAARNWRPGCSACPREGCAGKTNSICEPGKD